MHFFLPADRIIQPSDVPPSHNARIEQHSSHFSYVLALLLFASGYHWLLCLLQYLGLPASPLRVGIAEFLIYLGCIPLLTQHISARAIAAILLIIATTALLAIFRDGNFDIKSIRDLAIPVLFIWAGRSWRGSLDDINRVIRIIVFIVLAIGLLEAVFFETYTHFINTFNYYINLGGIQADSAQITGQTVTLNGLRPEGIGRTILPQVFGSHRISSIFLEPVSFGNFAVILMAWGLCKPSTQWRSMAFFVVSALLMIALADSRFALYSVSAMLLLRLLVRKELHHLTIILPLIGILVLLVVANYSPSGGDNLHGRLTSSGLRLQSFDVSTLLGFGGYNLNFGDMGYAHVISRLGLPLAIMLWVFFYLLPLPTEQSLRYRTFASAYIALILCISGTSVFALKTAAIFWYLFGVLSIQKPNADTAKSTANGNWSAGINPVNNPTRPA